MTTRVARGGARSPGTTAPAPDLGALSRVLGAVTALVAVVVLTGWLVGVEEVTSLVPGYATMKFNTAGSIALIALSLLLTARPVQAGLAAGAALLTSATLLQMVAGIGLGIDQLVVADPATAAADHPGRMAPATAGSLLILAVARLLSWARRGRLAEWTALVALLIGSLAILGYLYDAEELYQVVTLSSVALHTAAAVIVLALGIMATVPGGVLTWAATGTGPGAAVVRQTVPIIAIGMPTLGLLRHSLAQADLYGEHFGTALLALFGGTFAVAVTVRAARTLDRADEARRAAEEELHRLNSSLIQGRDEAWERARLLGDELAAERSRFDRAVGKSDDLIWTAEVADGEIRLVYASPGAAGIFGGSLPGEEPTWSAMVRTVHPEDVVVYEDFARRMLAGEAAEMELRVTGVDGAVRWVWVRGTPREEAERRFYDGIATNVTDRRRLAEERERLLVQEQEHVRRLSELNQMREEFIAIAGHELRTPISVILGYCELLADPSPDPEQMREAVAIIERRARQLKELVDRVFDVAKLDAGVMELTPVPVDLRVFVEDLVAEYGPQAAVAGVRISAETTPVMVEADRGRLRQVLDNLLSNAIKYTPPGGEVRLRSGSEEGEAFVEVADTGIGVAEDELPHLFDRLYRARSARERGIPGTGLGLAVSRALAEAHGGSLTVEPNHPRGMVAMLRIPAVRVPAR